VNVFHNKKLIFYENFKKVQMMLNQLQSAFLQDYFIKHESISSHQFTKISNLLSIDKRMMYIAFIKFRTELKYSQFLPQFLIQL
jgi:hypothetical protein